MNGARILRSDGRRLMGSGLLLLSILCGQMALSQFDVANCRAQSNPSISDEDRKILQGTSLAPKAFRAAANRVLPSLVTIESFGGVTAVQGRIGGIRKQGEGNTTGILISSEGHIVTSTFNFIQRPPVIMVVTRDGKRHVAQMLGQDKTRKICMLKIDPVPDIPVPEMAPLDQLKVGQWAISVGVGYGDKNPAISAGIISATQRISGRAVQTDANISPANYGGPLLDIEGRIIGICVPLSPRSQEIGSGAEWYDSGIGFAAPLHQSDQLLEKLKKGENILPARLGIQPKGNHEPAGVIVGRVQSKTPARKAGLKKDDIILALNGRPIRDSMDLQIELGRYIAGDTIQVTVQRKQEKKTFEVELDSAVKPASSPFEFPQSGR